MKSFIHFLIMVLVFSAPLLAHETIQHELEISTLIDINRTLPEQWKLSGIYDMNICRHFRLSAGLSLDILGLDLDADFLELGYIDLAGIGLDIRLKFLGDIYSSYDKAANSIIPYLRYETEYWYVIMGLHFRFLNAGPGQLYNPFYYTEEVRESFIYGGIGGKLPLFNQKLMLIFEISNHDDFYAGNSGIVFYKLMMEYRLQPDWELFLRLKAIPSGSIALAANAYRFGIEMGAEVRL